MLISHTSEALIVIDTNDSTLTSPDAEVSSFQNSFCGLYSVLKLPIYWHFNRLPVSSTCSYIQPLSNGGQQYESAAGVRVQGYQATFVSQKRDEGLFLFQDFDMLVSPFSFLISPFAANLVNGKSVVFLNI